MQCSSSSARMTQMPTFTLHNAVFTDSVLRVLYYTNQTSRGDRARAFEQAKASGWRTSQMNTANSELTLPPWERELERQAPTLGILEPRPVLSDTARHGCAGSGWGFQQIPLCVLSRRPPPTPLHCSPIRTKAKHHHEQVQTNCPSHVDCDAQ